MRYDTAAYLYDAKLQLCDEKPWLCNISDMGAVFVRQAFGESKAARFIVRTRRPIPFRTGYFEIDGKVYKTIKPVEIGDRFTHYVEEYKAGIQHGHGIQA